MLSLAHVWKKYGARLLDIEAQPLSDIARHCLCLHACSTESGIMSLTIPQASQQGLFKQGYNSYDAEDGAVIRNVGIIGP